MASAVAPELDPDVAADQERAREELKFGRYVRHLKIADRKSNAMVPFTPNSIQRRVRAEIERQQREGRPVRIIILKSRRMGCSTIIQATFAHLAFVTRRFTAITGAHEDKSSAHLHGMVESMYENLPVPLRPEKRVGIRGKRLEFTSGSDLMTFTAGGSSEGQGRGLSARAIHGSEVAYWRDAVSTLVSLRQIVPNEPGTLVILESTANGLGNPFHDEWARAVAGESDYVPMFFGWFEFDEYREPLTQPLGALDAEEQALVANYGVDEEQLNWRRQTLKNECGGKIDKFHEEYPATATEAFLSSGRRYFSGLSAIKTTPPSRRGYLRTTGAIGGKRAHSFRDSPDGPISIWETPKPGRQYVIGADVAGSVIGVEYDARPAAKKKDAYCAYVADVESGRTVASLYGRDWIESHYAELLNYLGRVYNTATIGVEKQGGFGTHTILQLRDHHRYPRQFEVRDDDSTEGNDTTGALGIPMTPTTRPIVLAALDQALAEAPGTLVDPALIDEMATFVVNSGGKAEADRGCHDDRVMARAITQYMRDQMALRFRRAASSPLTKKPTSDARRLIERAPRIR